MRRIDLSHQATGRASGRRSRRPLGLCRYQYDGSAGDCYNHLASGGSLATVFTAHAHEGGAEELAAVSCFLRSANVDYAVQVYLNPPDATNPSSGTPALSEPVRGKTSYAGYYVIDLPSPVYLAEGTTFLVVITLSHDDQSECTYVVDTSYGANGRYAENNRYAHFTSAVTPGQSFVRNAAGETWHGLASEEVLNEGDEPAIVARVRAFTN